MTHTARTAQLKQMLRSRRHELQADLLVRLRDGRAGHSTDGRDDLEHTDADSLEDIAFSMLQMRADMAERIGEALLRLDAGQYGRCVDCDGGIPKRRLRALPFAVRCRACESLREQARGHAHAMGWRRSGLSLFVAPAGS
jgi:DnaK suppressor protein